MSYAILLKINFSSFFNCSTSQRWIGKRSLNSTKNFLPIPQKNEDAEEQEIKEKYAELTTITDSIYLVPNLSIEILVPHKAAELLHKDPTTTESLNENLSRIELIWILESRSTPGLFSVLH